MKALSWNNGSAMRVRLTSSDSWNSYFVQQLKQHLARRLRHWTCLTDAQIVQVRQRLKDFERSASAQDRSTCVNTPRHVTQSRSRYVYYYFLCTRKLRCFARSVKTKSTRARVQGLPSPPPLSIGGSQRMSMRMTVYVSPPGLENFPPPDSNRRQSASASPHVECPARVCVCVCVCVCTSVRGRERNSGCKPCSMLVVMYPFNTAGIRPASVWTEKRNKHTHPVYNKSYWHTEGVWRMHACMQQTNLQTNTVKTSQQHTIGRQAKNQPVTRQRYAGHTFRCRVCINVNLRRHTMFTLWATYASSVVTWCEGCMLWACGRTFSLCRKLTKVIISFRDRRPYVFLVVIHSSKYWPRSRTLNSVT
jgi:hypothetical protein